MLSCLICIYRWSKGVLQSPPIQGFSEEPEGMKGRRRIADRWHVMLPAAAGGGEHGAEAGKGGA